MDTQFILLLKTKDLRQISALCRSDSQSRRGIVKPEVQPKRQRGGSSGFEQNQPVKDAVRSCKIGFVGHETSKSRSPAILALLVRMLCW
jgi:hypothetical protein